MKQKNIFLLNFILAVIVAIIFGFIISKIVYNKELEKTIKDIENASLKRVNFVDLEENRADKSITGSISHNLNDKVWLVVNKKIQTKNILDSIYFQDDFITSAIVVTNDGWLISKKLINTKNIALVNQNNEIVDIDYVVQDGVLGVSYIKINKSGLSPIGIADSSSLGIGQSVYAIKSSSYSNQNEIINNSIINLHSRLIKSKNDLIHLPNDVIIAGMFSDKIDDGLLIVNENSEMIGLSFNDEENTYLLPSNYIKYSLTRLFNNDKNIDYPTLNISYIDLSEVVSSVSFGSMGAYVYESTNPLIKKADVLTKINDDVLNQFRSLNTVLLDYTPGAEVRITLVRDGKDQEIKVKLNSLKK